MSATSDFALVPEVRAQYREYVRPIGRDFT
jgi:hypothetical protein